MPDLQQGLVIMKMQISGMGMVSSLGHDALTSCAGIRAGLSRATPLPKFQVSDPDSQTMVGLIGHAVWGIPETASPIARWLWLAQMAFDDLCRSGEFEGRRPDSRWWRRTGLFLVTPALDDGRFFFFPPCYQEDIHTTFVGPLLRTLGIAIEKENVRLISQGRTGAMRAFKEAQALFTEEQLDRIVVLAVDSCLDDFTLGWLMNADRLKSAEQPSGLMPGEAAAAVLIEPAATSAAERIERCLLRSAVQEQEAGPFVDGERRHGRALARSMGAALLESGTTSPFEGDIVVDLNGEAWRAYEWGAALTQVPRTLLQSPKTVAPAISIGDVGAASALAGTVLAVRAIERGYATARNAMVACASPDGRVGALMVGTE